MQQVRLQQKPEDTEGIKQVMDSVGDAVDPFLDSCLFQENETLTMKLSNYETLKL